MKCEVNSWNGAGGGGGRRRFPCCSVVIGRIYCASDKGDNSDDQGVVYVAYSKVSLGSLKWNRASQEIRRALGKMIF